MFKRKSKQQTFRTPRPSAQPSTVFSYYSSRSRTDASTGRYQEPTKRESRWKYIPSYIAAAAVLVSVFVALSLNGKPKIQSVAQQTPNILRSNEIYEESAAEILAQSIFNKSKLTINTNEVADELQARFPELDSVAMTLPLLGRRPVIEIAPAEAVLILANQSGAFAVDGHGKALLRVNELPQVLRSELPIVRDDLGLQIQAGKAVLPEDTVQFIRVLIRQLKAKRIAVDSMSLPAIANEMHLQLKDQKYIVKFNLQDDPLQQAGAFIAVKERLEGERSLPKEYIDVRVEERAYYR